jgi:hypothetical protein
LIGRSEDDRSGKPVDLGGAELDDSARPAGCEKRVDGVVVREAEAGRRCVGDGQGDEEDGEEAQDTG